MRQWQANKEAKFFTLPRRICRSYILLSLNHPHHNSMKFSTWCFAAHSTILNLFCIWREEDVRKKNWLKPSLPPPSLSLAAASSSSSCCESMFYIMKKGVELNLATQKNYHSTHSFWASDKWRIDDIFGCDEK